MAARADILERTRTYYDRVGDRYLELFRDELAQKPWDRALLARFAAPLGAGARVCDAGCGPCGHVTRLLSGLGLEVFGVDLSPRCVELARASQPRLSFRVMDMGRLDLPSGSLDGLVAYYSILYTAKADLPALFREFRRVLKPAGSLLVVVKEGEGEGWIDDPMGTGEATYFANFREDELAALLEAGGFRVQSREARDPYPFEFQVRRLAFTARPADPSPASEELPCDAR